MTTIKSCRGCNQPMGKRGANCEYARFGRHQQIIGCILNRGKWPSRNNFHPKPKKKVENNTVKIDIGNPIILKYHAENSAHANRSTKKPYGPNHRAVL